MAPSTLMPKLMETGIEIFAITDHNSMSNIEVFQYWANKYDIVCLSGIEVQTSEEVHLIALFDRIGDAKQFANELYNSLLPIENDPDYFGDQVIIDRYENIIGIEERALINSSMWDLDTTIQKITENNGFWFPAHEDEGTFSITAQLGFFPQHIEFQAIGISACCKKENLFTKFPYMEKYALIRNSDAHYIEDVGKGYSMFYIEEPTVAEIQKACMGIEGRKVNIKEII